MLAHGLPSRLEAQFALFYVRLLVWRWHLVQCIKCNISRCTSKASHRDLSQAQPARPATSPKSTANMPPIPSTPRVITYYQTHHTPGPDGQPISVLPLITQDGIGLTHLIVGAVHLNLDPNQMTLNDHHPGHQRFDTLWAEMRILQAAGVKVLAMLGGAAKGTFQRLDQDAGTFELYYEPLADLVRRRALDGVDLDVEEDMSLAGIVRLIDRLRRDFGSGFLITMAPVAAALVDPRANLSGFDYFELEQVRGHEIAWYHAQFYCGWGDCSNPAVLHASLPLCLHAQMLTQTRQMYSLIISKGWDPAKVVVGLVTNPANGSGYVPWEILVTVIPFLIGRNPSFGGVSGWEYFNALPGGEERPWEWAMFMTALLRGERAVADGDQPVLRAIESEAQKEQVELEKKKREEEEEREQQHAAEKGARQPPHDDDDQQGPEAPVPGDFEYYSDEEKQKGSD